MKSQKKAKIIKRQRNGKYKLKNRNEKENLN